jgi:hypothetical protein
MQNCKLARFFGLKPEAEKFSSRGLKINAQTRISASQSDILVVVDCCTIIGA